MLQLDSIGARGSGRMSSQSPPPARSLLMYTLPPCLTTTGTGFLKDAKPVQLTAGQEVTITTDYSYKGDEKMFAMTYKYLVSWIII